MLFNQKAKKQALEEWLSLCRAGWDLLTPGLPAHKPSHCTPGFRRCGREGLCGAQSAAPSQWPGLRGQIGVQDFDRTLKSNAGSSEEAQLPKANSVSGDPAPNRLQGSRQECDFVQNYFGESCTRVHEFFSMYCKWGIKFNFSFRYLGVKEGDSPVVSDLRIWGEFPFSGMENGVRMAGFSWVQFPTWTPSDRNREGPEPRGPRVTVAQLGALCSGGSQW